MTRQEADGVSRSLAALIRAINDLQVDLPHGAIVIDGLCHAAMVLLHEAMRECGKAMGIDP